MIPKLPKLPKFYIDELINRALTEDVNYIDVATDSIIDAELGGRALLIAKRGGVIAGLDAASRVFELLDPGIRIIPYTEDGKNVEKSDVIAKIAGKANAMLKAERTALNILQHMSGIATYTRECANAVKGTNAVIADTRKTLPGLRALQKYAVLCGGGSNHRFNLSSAALIKDNHIDACGGIAEAVEAVRKAAGHTVVVEVEVRTLDELQTALDAKAEIIMLDNMSVELMKEAVKITANRAKLEASGDITLDNIRKVAETGVDIISLGALTHSVKALDISMKWEK